MKRIGTKKFLNTKTGLFPVRKTSALGSVLPMKHKTLMLKTNKTSIFHPEVQQGEYPFQGRKNFSIDRGNKSDSKALSSKKVPTNYIGRVIQGPKRNLLSLAGKRIQSLSFSSFSSQKQSVPSAVAFVQKTKLFSRSVPESKVSSRVQTIWSHKRTHQQQQAEHESVQRQQILSLLEGSLVRVDEEYEISFKQFCASLTLIWFSMISAFVILFYEPEPQEEKKQIRYPVEFQKNLFRE